MVHCGISRTLISEDIDSGFLFSIYVTRLNAHGTGGKRWNSGQDGEVYAINTVPVGFAAW